MGYTSDIRRPAAPALRPPLPMSRITAWGNSHGVRIPREILDQADIAPESEVTVTAEAGRIVIEPARRKPTLSELLARMRPGEPEREVDYGPPLGREVL